MIKHKYIDENGNDSFVISAIPGVTFTPPGCKISDAVEMTKAEIAKVSKRHPHKPVEDVSGIVAALTLKADKDKLDIETLATKNAELEARLLQAETDLTDIKAKLK